MNARFPPPSTPPDTRAEPIQALIPIGLEAVNVLLQQEVCQLAGERYRRQGGVPGYARWGGRRGSIYLGDRTVAIRVPRLRDTRRGREIPLSTHLRPVREGRLSGSAAGLVV